MRNNEDEEGNKAGALCEEIQLKMSECGEKIGI
jgi:hypothetical protein